MSIAENRPPVPGIPRAGSPRNTFYRSNMMGRNYIPSRDADFDRRFSFLYRYVSKKCAGTSPERAHIPQAALTKLGEVHAAWKTAYTIGPHTKVDTGAKNDARKAALLASRLVPEATFTWLPTGRTTGTRPWRNFPPGPAQQIPRLRYPPGMATGDEIRAQGNRSAAPGAGAFFEKSPAG
jgi:hypothetical protein